MAYICASIEKMELTALEFKLLKELYLKDCWCTIPENSNRIAEIEGLKIKYLAMTGINCVRITYIGKKFFNEYIA